MNARRNNSAWICLTIIRSGLFRELVATYMRKTSIGELPYSYSACACVNRCARNHYALAFDWTDGTSTRRRGASTSRRYSDAGLTLSIGSERFVVWDRCKTKCVAGAGAKLNSTAATYLVFTPAGGEPPPPPPPPGTCAAPVAGPVKPTPSVVSGSGRALLTLRCAPRRGL